MRPFGAAPDDEGLEGRIQEFGRFATGVRHARGAKRVVGLILLAALVVPVLIGVILGIVEMITGHHY